MAHTLLVQSALYLLLLSAFCLYLDISVWCMFSFLQYVPCCNIFGLDNAMKDQSRSVHTSLLLLNYKQYMSTVQIKPDLCHIEEKPIVFDCNISCMIQNRFINPFRSSGCTAVLCDAITILTSAHLCRHHVSLCWVLCCSLCVHSLFILCVLLCILKVYATLCCNKQLTVSKPCI